jgi:hypothetical protein
VSSRSVIVTLIRKTIETSMGWNITITIKYQIYKILKSSENPFFISSATDFSSTCDKIVLQKSGKRKNKISDFY